MSDKVRVKDYSEVKDVVELSFGERSSITNRRGNVVKPRKYHMTFKQLFLLRERWLSNVAGCEEQLKEVSSKFFNPYRENGAYYGGVQSLFLLGGNKWHSFGEVRSKMCEDMSTRRSSSNKKDSWEKFAFRGAREGASSSRQGS